jgi:hypothetical protein
LCIFGRSGWKGDVIVSFVSLFEYYNSWNIKFVSFGIFCIKYILMDINTKVAVIDNGTGYTKMGYAGNT